LKYSTLRFSSGPLQLHCAIPSIAASGYVGLWSVFLQALIFCGLDHLVGMLGVEAVSLCRMVEVALLLQTEDGGNTTAQLPKHFA